MIHNIIDLDEHILKYCDHNTLIQISMVNKHYHDQSLIVIVNDLLKQFKHNDKVKTIHKIVHSSPCSYCGCGHMVDYYIEFVKGFGIVDHFTGCLTYEEECHVMYFDTLELLNDYTAKYG